MRGTSGLQSTTTIRDEPNNELNWLGDSIWIVFDILALATGRVFGWTVPVVAKSQLEGRCVDWQHGGRAPPRVWTV